MSAPLVVEDRDASTWHRLSPRMLLIHPITEFVRALPALAGIFLAGHAGGHGLITSLIVTGVVVLLAISRWFTTRLRITETQVELRQGLLRRRTIATRRESIRTVDVTSHVLHRLLGLSRVVVGTGLSDRKNEGRIVLDGLTVAAAESLRIDLLHRAAPDPHVAGAPTTAPPAAHELARLDRRWIGLAPFTLSGVVTGLIIWGFAWRVQGESGVDLLHSGPLRAIGRGLDHVPTVVAVLIVGLAIVVFIAVTSLVGYVLAFWNFRLVRHDGGTLQVTRGLLTTRATSIERRRLVGVEISEPLLLRAVGGARTQAVATGLRVGRGSEKGGEVLLPPAPIGVARDVAARALDGTRNPPDGGPADGRIAITADLQPHGRAARRRRLVRATAGGVLILVGTVIGWLTGGSVWAVPIGIAVLAASVLIGLDRGASLGHARVGGYLVTRYGSLVRRRVVLGADSVIGWNLRTTFFQRRVGLATLTATTAAGRQGYSVVDMTAQDAIALAAAVTPDLLTEFRIRPARSTPSASVHPAPMHPVTAR